MGSIRITAAVGLIAASIWPVMGVCTTQSADYVGIDVGLIQRPDTAHFVVTPLVLDGDIPTNHEIDRGWIIGHSFNPNLAIEAGYRDLGTLAGPLNAAQGFGPAQGSFRLTFKGATLAVVGILPLGHWEAYGKLGTMITDTQLSLDATGDAGTVHLRSSAWNAAAMGEVGVRYRVSTRWDVGLAAGAFLHLGQKYETGTVNLKTTNLTLRYHF